MSWREAIARRLIEAAQARDARTVARGIGYPSAEYRTGNYADAVFNQAAQQEINAIQNAESALNAARGDRMFAAEDQQGYLNRLLATPGANQRNIDRTRDTLGVLQSEHPLDVWWNR